MHLVHSRKERGVGVHTHRIVCLGHMSCDVGCPTTDVEMHSIVDCLKTVSVTGIDGYVAQIRRSLHAIAKGNMLTSRVIAHLKPVTRDHEFPKRFKALRIQDAHISTWSTQTVGISVCSSAKMRYILDDCCRLRVGLG